MINIYLNKKYFSLIFKLMDNNNQKEEQIKMQLKETIIKYNNQLKSGCYRDLCYNFYCKKSKSKIIK
jgi:hypothetical protein